MLLTLFPLFFLHTLLFGISLFLAVFFLNLSLSVCVLSQCFSLCFFPSHSLCFSLSVCLSGMVWLVLIYSHHYLVLGEDKHAFACLMNQTPPIPLSMRTHTYTGVHRYTNAHAHTHTNRYTLLLLALQASVSLPLTWSHQLLTPTGVNMAYLSAFTSTAGMTGRRTLFDLTTSFQNRKEII